MVCKDRLAPPYSDNSDNHKDKERDNVRKNLELSIIIRLGNLVVSWMANRHQGDKKQV